MARSRKRRVEARGARPAPPPRGTEPPAHEGRSEAARPEPPAPKARAEVVASQDTMSRGYARTRARDEAVRAQLEPLAPGERPRAMTIAAVVAAIVAVANVALLLSGWEVQGEEVKPAGVLIFAALMLAAAVGMWQRRYWAVLGFQALLGISILFASLSLLVASNVQAALLCLVIVLFAGTLFWFLVRAMARLKMPQRPARITS